MGLQICRRKPTMFIPQSLHELVGVMNIVEPPQQNIPQHTSDINRDKPIEEAPCFQAPLTVGCLQALQKSLPMLPKRSLWPSWKRRKRTFKPVTETEQKYIELLKLRYQMKRQEKQRKKEEKVYRKHLSAGLKEEKKRYDKQEKRRKKGEREYYRHQRNADIDEDDKEEIKYQRKKEKREYKNQRREEKEEKKRRAKEKKQRKKEEREYRKQRNAELEDEKRKYKEEKKQRKREEKEYRTKREAEIKEEERIEREKNKYAEKRANYMTSSKPKKQRRFRPRRWAHIKRNVHFPFEKKRKYKNQKIIYEKSANVKPQARSKQVYVKKYSTKYPLTHRFVNCCYRICCQIYCCLTCLIIIAIAISIFVLN